MMGAAAAAAAETRGLSPFRGATFLLFLAAFIQCALALSEPGGLGPFVPAAAGDAATSESAAAAAGASWPLPAAPLLSKRNRRSRMQELEDAFSASVSNSSAARSMWDITREPHVAGTPESEQLAEVCLSTLPGA